MGLVPFGVISKLNSSSLVEASCKGVMGGRNKLQELGYRPVRLCAHAVENHWPIKVVSVVTSCVS